MGLIRIEVPGNMNLKYRVEASETIEKIIRIIKAAGEQTPKKQTDDIVGIWEDRFEDSIPTEMIQKEFREKTWKRFW